MDIQLRRLREFEEAVELGPELDVYIAQATSDFRDNAPPAGTGLKMLERVFDAPEGVVLLAETDSGERLGYCVVGPLIDPVVGDRWPMVLALWVHPDYRHRGLGGSLIKRVIADLHADGGHALAARAGHNDDALISMGERWGFVRHWELMIHEPE
ncbi:MAG: GNAT superfamily N-acetyltransferase [Planctomycetota bacterium]|jgi:GNAT superfamily N-acetyltransferase